jgi:hypothetical protein
VSRRRRKSGERRLRHSVDHAQERTGGTLRGTLATLPIPHGRLRYADPPGEFRLRKAGTAPHPARPKGGVLGRLGIVFDGLPRNIGFARSVHPRPIDARLRALPFPA